jgi:hypothetical protein
MKYHNPPSPFSTSILGPLFTGLLGGGSVLSPALVLNPSTTQTITVYLKTAAEFYFVAVGYRQGEYRRCKMQLLLHPKL